jgi:hypothetical protein
MHRTNLSSQSVFYHLTLIPPTIITKKSKHCLSPFLPMPVREKLYLLQHNCSKQFFWETFDLNNEISLEQ